MTTRNQRSYTGETRNEAVELSKRIGASAAAREMGIPADTLYTWISRAKTGSLPSTYATAAVKTTMKPNERIKALEQENKRLQAENAQLKKEHQILEEAAAFFASRRKRSGNA